jgi:lipopolysaccharide export system protein LptA
MNRMLVSMLAATMMAATACTNDATSPTVSTAGTWNLRTLNGQQVPVQVGNNVVITGEQLTLNGDGTYNDVVFYSTGNSSTEFGYYTLNNNAITFVDQTDNITYSGSISGDVLTAISGNFTSVYQKS